MILLSLPKVPLTFSSSIYNKIFSMIANTIQNEPSLINIDFIQKILKSFTLMNFITKNNCKEYIYIILNHQKNIVKFPMQYFSDYNKELFLFGEYMNFKNYKSDNIITFNHIEKDLITAHRIIYRIIDKETIFLNEEDTNKFLSKNILILENFYKNLKEKSLQFVAELVNVFIQNPLSNKSKTSEYKNLMEKEIDYPFLPRKHLKSYAKYVKKVLKKLVHK